MNEYLQSSGLVDVRVDDRMVHGIVATMWIPENHCTRVMVVNEDASNNQVIRSTLKMSVPAGVSLSVLAPEKAAANIKNGNYTDQRVFIVGREIQDVYALYKAGVQFARVNLGNVTQNTGETLILDKTVRVNNEEKAMLREMRDAGIQITCQFRTDDPVKVCRDILEEKNVYSNSNHSGLRVDVGIHRHRNERSAFQLWCSGTAWFCYRLNHGRCCYRFDRRRHAVPDGFGRRRLRRILRS